MPKSHMGPPEDLQEDLELDPTTWSPKDVYFLQSALIVPRPIAWVSTVTSDGADNLAPHSYFNGICDDPPMVMFSIEAESDTYRNVRDVPEFVVNLVTLNLGDQMEISASAIPFEESEFEWAGLATTPAKTIAPKRVSAAKACLECYVDQIIDVGRRNHMVIGTVKHFHVSRDIWKDGRVDPSLYNPLCRLGGRYATLGDVFKISRPTWEEIQKKNSSKPI